MKASFCGALVIIHLLHFESKKEKLDFQFVSAWVGIHFKVHGVIKGCGVVLVLLWWDTRKPIILPHKAEWWQLMGNLYKQQFFNNTSQLGHQVNCFYVVSVCFLLLLPYGAMTHHHCYEHYSYAKDLCDAVMKEKGLEIVLFLSVSCIFFILSGGKGLIFFSTFF